MIPKSKYYMSKNDAALGEFAKPRGNVKLPTVLAVISAALALLAAATGFPWLAALAAPPAAVAAWLIWRSAPTLATQDDFPALLINAQEAERKRLSRDLHDGVGQVITALKMELARVEGTDEEKVRLDRARSHADEALTTIRNVSRLLRPTLLDDLGLEAALQWHLEDYGRRTGIATELSFELPGEELLSEAINTCIYRTIQESLNNCEKHAAATRVRITIAQENNQLHVSISDNGRGMKAAPMGKDKHGIRGMEERAQILEGHLHVESNEGKGTTVNLTLPW